MIFWSSKQLKFALSGVVAGVALIAAGAYLSFSNIAPRQSRAKARKDYIKARLKQLVQYSNFRPIWAFGCSGKTVFWQMVQVYAVYPVLRGNKCCVVCGSNH